MNVEIPDGKDVGRPESGSTNSPDISRGSRRAQNSSKFFI